MNTKLNEAVNEAAAVDADQIYAYVDGELAAEAQAAFEARLAQDPALQYALARQQRLRRTLGDVFAPVLEEPVPERLSALLQPSATVASLDQARARRGLAASWNRAPWPYLGGMAASLMLGTLLGYQLLPPAAGPSVDGNLWASASLAQALDQQLSGQAAGTVTPGLSFVAKGGGYCRSFTTQGGTASSAGLACRDGEHWRLQQIEALPTEPGAAAGQYRQAATALPQALLQSIDALREGDVLDAAAETQARARGWKPSSSQK